MDSGFFAVGGFFLRRGFLFSCRGLLFRSVDPGFRRVLRRGGGDGLLRFREKDHFPVVQTGDDPGSIGEESAQDAVGQFVLDISFDGAAQRPCAVLGVKALPGQLLHGGIAGVHCENAGVIDALIAAHKAAGQTAPSSHPECRPNPLEAEAVAHLLRITEVAGVPIVIVHLSTKEALLEVMRARARGQQVYVETCPHYLLLDDSVYYQEDYSAAARYICAPPMRKKEDQEVLWKALANGTIQTVSTDHCSFTLQQKDAGRGDFTKIPGGLPGVETRGELLYTAGVATGRITKEQMCALLSENPARLYGAYPRKGVIAPGSDADLVVYDPAADKTITAGTQLSAAGYTPYEGWRTKGSIAQVYLRGTLAVDHGEMKAGPIGTYIPRHPGAL